MTRLKRYVRSPLAAIVVAISIPFAASAQSDDPIVAPTLPVDRSPPPSKGTCAGQYDNVTIDPHRPSRGRNARTFKRAMCIARPGATVTVRQKRKGGGAGEIGAYREQIVVRKEGLRFIAAAGEAVLIKPPVVGQPCIDINVKTSKRFDDSSIATLFEGVTILSGAGAGGSCVDVRVGELKLKNSRITMSSAGTAITVHGTGLLTFEGVNHEQHGVFQETQTSTGAGVGVVALANTKRITLRGVRFTGLETAVRSKADTTNATGVQFFGNGTGIDVIDRGPSEALAPNLSVSGGVFRDNGSGIILRDHVGADVPSVPYRGDISITSREAGQTLFQNNERGIVLEATGLYAPELVPDGEELEAKLEVEGVTFRDNGPAARQIAVSLSLRDGGRANFKNVYFDDNAASIDVEGPMNGWLDLNDIHLTHRVGSAPIRISEGFGTLKAVFEQVPPKSSSFVFGPFLTPDPSDDSFDYFSIEVNAAAPRNFIRYEAANTLCQLRASKKDDRVSFLKTIRNLQVKANGAPLYSWLLSDKQGLSRGDVSRFQRDYCY